MGRGNPLRVFTAGAQGAEFSNLLFYLFDCHCDNFPDEFIIALAV